MQRDSNIHEKSLRDIYLIIFKNKRKIIWFFLATVFTVAVGTFMTPETYRSNAKLMIRLGRESVSLDPTATTGKVINIEQQRESEINSELEILSSRELAEKVVDKIGPMAIIYGPPSNTNAEEPILKAAAKKVKRILMLPLTAAVNFIHTLRGPDPLKELKTYDLAVQMVMQGMHVEALKKSNILHISYDANNPLLARDVVKDLISFFLDKHIAAHRTAGSFEFFNEQSAHLRDSLAETERELNELKNQTGTGSLEEQRRILLQRIGDLQTESETTTSLLAASTAKTEALKAKLKALPETLQMEQITGFPSSAADEVRKKLNEFLLKEQELLSVYTEKSIPVQEVRRQIKEARLLLDKTEPTQQTTRGINQTYQQIQKDLLTEEATLSALRAKSGTLKEQLENAQAELIGLNNTETLLAKYRREMQIQEANYKSYAASLEQARIDQALEIEKISNISVIQAPSLPLEPILPRKRLNLLLGICLGLFGGLSLAFVSDYFDHSFKTPEDVEEHLGLPVLISVPILPEKSIFHVGKEPSRPPQRKDQLLAINDKFGELVQCEKAELENLLAPAKPKPFAPKVFAITGCYRGEGVSTVAAVFSATLASRTDQRVLLVDCNLADPSLHELFGLSGQQGLGDFIFGDCDHASAMRQSHLPNLDILCAGKAHSQASNIEKLKALIRCLGHWKRDYGFIVFDSPSLEEGSEALGLGKLSDAVILVLEAEKTRREVAQKAKEKLTGADVTLHGVVLNKRKFYIPQWLYRTL